jgi:hypothetical protein
MEKTEKYEVKNVKHTFTPVERQNIGDDLARAIGTLRGVQGDFDKVKAGFKAKVTESEARIDNLSTALVNGFDMRDERCRVVYRPAAKEKDYFLENKDASSGPELKVLTEPMRSEDFQAELIQAESKFDAREEIDLFKPTPEDSGKLVVGRFSGKWFSALRVKIGKLELNERLDSEQRSFKQRPDAVSHAIKRVKDWASENMKEHAKGFDQSFDGVIEAQKDRAE